MQDKNTLIKLSQLPSQSNQLALNPAAVLHNLKMLLPPVMWISQAGAGFITHVLFDRNCQGPARYLEVLLASNVYA